MIYIKFKYFEYASHYTIINLQKSKLDFNRDCEDSRKASVTKNYSVSSNHDAKLLDKRWSQKIKSFWRYIISNTNKSYWPREFWVNTQQNQNVKLLKMNEWIYYFRRCLLISKNKTVSITSRFNLDIMQI